MDDRLKDLLKASTRWLNAPCSGDVKVYAKTGSELATEITAALKTSPDFAKELGPVLGATRARINQVQNMEGVDWIQVGKGRLSIGHRPSKRKLDDLAILGATHIGTLLTESEGANEVGKIARKVGLGWEWCPVEGAKISDPAIAPQLKKSIESLTSLLEDEGTSLYIHCSAGIHRTGMIAYGILLASGHSKSEAHNLLGQLRQETLNGVEDARLEFIEAMILD